MYPYTLQEFKEREGDTGKGLERVLEKDQTAWGGRVRVVYGWKHGRFTVQDTIGWGASPLNPPDPSLSEEGRGLMQVCRGDSPGTHRKALVHCQTAPGPLRLEAMSSGSRLLTPVSPSCLR